MKSNGNTIFLILDPKCVRIYTYSSFLYPFSHVHEGWCNIQWKRMPVETKAFKTASNFWIYFILSVIYERLTHIKKKWATVVLQKNSYWNCSWSLLPNIILALASNLNFMTAKIAHCPRSMDVNFSFSGFSVCFFFFFLYFQDLNNRLCDTVLWFTCIFQGNTHWLRQIPNPSQDNNNNNVILIPRWNHFLKRWHWALQRFYLRRRALGSHLKYTAIKITHTAHSCSPC